MRTLFLPLLALGACSGPPASNVASVDIGNAADAAQGSVDNYAAMKRRPAAEEDEATAGDRRR